MAAVVSKRQWADQVKSSVKVIQLSVIDKGPGISDAEKMLIFDKFYRVGNENVRKAKGTGLGLFIVDQLVKIHVRRTVLNRLVATCCKSVFSTQRFNVIF